MKSIDYPDWICSDCGHRHGRGWPEGHCATWHIDTCGLCGQHKRVTEPRDFGHLKPGWEKEITKITLTSE